MVDFYLILQEIMNEKQMKVSDVAHACGLKDSTVRSIVLRRQKNVALEIAIKLSEGLGVSLERLSGRPEKESPSNEKGHLTSMSLTSKEIMHMEKYRNSLDDFGRETVDLVLDREVRRVEMFDHSSAITPSNFCISYYGKIAAAGFAVDSFSALMEGTIEVLDTAEARKANYAIGVSGDSMEPEYFDGDIVLVRKTDHVRIGEVGIFQKGNEVYIKQCTETGMHSFNPAYPDMMPDEEIYCLGKVIGKAELPE